MIRHSCRKMLIALLVLIAFVPASDASCIEKARARLGIHTWRSILIGGGGMMEACGQDMVGGEASNRGEIRKAKMAMNFALGALIGTALIIALKRLTSKPAHLVNVLRQAEICSGGAIHRLYRRYASESTAPVSQERFCEIIGELDRTEAFCKHNLPIKTEIIDTVVEKALEGPH